jgi:hypothetical protein
MMTNMHSQWPKNGVIGGAILGRFGLCKHTYYLIFYFLSILRQNLHGLNRVELDGMFP